jgi:hypothetical protein
MNDFASVLDDMYATTPVTLSDVKDLPKETSKLSFDPKLRLYAIGLGLSLLLLVAIVVFSRMKTVPARTISGTIPETSETRTVDVPLKKEIVSAPLTFQITEALVTAEETYEDEKISADREESIFQKYKERLG